MGIKISDYKYVSDSVKKENPGSQDVGQKSKNCDVLKTESIPSSLLKGAYGVIPFKGIR